MAGWLDRTGGQLDVVGKGKGQHTKYAMRSMHAWWVAEWVCMHAYIIHGGLVGMRSRRVRRGPTTTTYKEEAGPNNSNNSHYYEQVCRYAVYIAGGGECTGGGRRQLLGLIGSRW